MLYILFFWSGLSGLIFETLWFRQAGLTFGNSIWASSIVLASFMGGIALGNLFMVKFRDHVVKPALVYGLLELIIGITGLALVYGLPHLGSILTPAFLAFSKNMTHLNGFIFIVTFILMVIPATAMGTTLPILIRFETRRNSNYGHILGKLYGYNTLGAVIGALAGDLFFIKTWGIIGTAYFALGINIMLTLGALILSKYNDRNITSVHNPLLNTSKSETVTYGANSSRHWSLFAKLYGAAFFFGFLLLALEVIWFRFASLFLTNSNLIFSLMLAIVLFGISTGSIFSAYAFKQKAEHGKYLLNYAWAASSLVLITYLLTAFFPESMLLRIGTGMPSLVFLVLLMFPVSFCSGILFTLVGTKIKQLHQQESTSAAWLTFFNTSGAMFGAWFGGFVFLKYAGVEKSLFIISIGYAATGLLAFNKNMVKKNHNLRISMQRTLFLVQASLILAGLFFFPFGLMTHHFNRIILKRFSIKNEHILIQQEGITESTLLTKTVKYGKTIQYRMITNGFSMSGVSLDAMRYMKAYVFWPVMFNPDTESALLISYGVGNTASALIENRHLTKIDIVDISKDIINLSDNIYPDKEQNPIHDSRVTVHIEDGRHFLLTTNRKFDLITAEPPPPKNANIVNLYTQEYFQLIYNALSDGGVTTYWIPVDQMKSHDFLSIVKGFQNVFADATLWNVREYDWMIMGTRKGVTALSKRDLSRQWTDLKVIPILQSLGYESPGSMLTCFIAGPSQLNAWTSHVKPLVDNYPYRLSREHFFDKKYFNQISNVSACLNRFQESNWVKNHIPVNLYDQTITLFPFQQYVNDYYGSFTTNWTPRVDLNIIKKVDQIIEETSLQQLVLWLMNSNAVRVQISKEAFKQGTINSEILFQLAVNELSRRNYDKAASFTFQLEKKIGSSSNLALMQLYLLLKNGHNEEAEKLFLRNNTILRPNARDWLRNRFSL